MVEETTLQKAERLRREVRETTKILEAREKELEGLEKSCQHDWEEPIYTPEYRKAYTIPGDKPGTMGVDWRGPVDVPAETIPRWTRKCRKCGRVEMTNRFRTEGNPKKIPSFGS